MINDIGTQLLQVNVRLNGDKKYLFDDAVTLLSSVIYRKIIQIYYV